MKKAIIILATISIFSGCRPKTNKYMILANDGNVSVILNTETDEVYTVRYYLNEKAKIYKASLRFIQP